MSTKKSTSWMCWQEFSLQSSNCSTKSIWLCNYAISIISIVIQIYVCSIVFVIISHYLFTVSIAWARSGFDNLFPTPIPWGIVCGWVYCVYLWESHCRFYMLYDVRWTDECRSLRWLSPSELFPVPFCVFSFRSFQSRDWKVTRMLAVRNAAGKVAPTAR